MTRPSACGIDCAPELRKRAMTSKTPITQDVLTIPRKAPEGDKKNLVGLTREQLREALIAAGTPEKQAKMRTGQVWQWIYHWGVRDFDAMTNLAKAYRALLAENFVIEIPEVIRRLVSEDGTRKYLVRIAGGHEVEVVYIPEEGRGTLCISSQVGCTLTCSFCHTGTQKLVRNLTAAEIVGQIMVARDDLEEWPVPGAPKDETRLLVKSAAALKNIDLRQFSISPLFISAVNVLSPALENSTQKEAPTFRDAKELFMRAASYLGEDAGKLANTELRNAAINSLGSDAAQALLARYRELNSGERFENEAQKNPSNCLKSLA